ncbi:MAG: phosphate acetyltransferase [bacterium JZ-2024 1]
MGLREEALKYHSSGRKGKLEVVPTKPCRTQRELSLAYTPGVAEPSREIYRDRSLIYEYTARANLVAVVSNGTAVLGLGAVGAYAAKPVMEGKALLFKRFADVDAYDIEVDETDPDKLIEIVKTLEPTFGGINLEDIKAPECFYIEQKLIEQMEIPVFHDDQHGTAIISGAGLVNALEIVEKDIDKIKMVINGAGASGIACAHFFLSLGVKKENLIMCDTAGVIYEGRTENMNEYKKFFAVKTSARTLRDALYGADVFVGLSGPNVVDEKMLKTMADKPIIFAMANPDPEVPYEVAKKVRPDGIIATGRSDYPNQVNNVLGFPFIFRGALDCQSRKINLEMKLAASKALADLAKQPVPESVIRAYGGQEITFGPDYIIPKPFDYRVLLWEAPAVAEAAMKTGVARKQLDIEEYKQRLAARLGRTQEVMRVVIEKARSQPKRIVFSEGEEEKILKAVARIQEEGIAYPVLLGNPEIIKEKMHHLHLPMNQVEIINPDTSPKREIYAQALFEKRKRKGITLTTAREMIRNRNVFALMMVEMGDADGFIGGVNQEYPEVVRPALQIIGSLEKECKVSGVFIIILKDRVLFFADTTMNIEPTSEELADFAVECAKLAKSFGIQPRIAMLSFSNFGSVRHPRTDKVRRATEILKERHPDLIADGEMQADTALVEDILREAFPFTALGTEPANILIFPDLNSANIGYKLVERLAGAEAIGPILIGMRKPVHVLQRGCEVESIFNMTAIAVVEAQEK